jgi:AcrR family transcriptional regulator
MPRTTPAQTTRSSRHTPERTLRSDAERNRLTILAAATEALTELGLDVSVDEIARRSGVGSATIYRRFPTRDDLLVAALEERVRDYADLVDSALDETDPWKAFSDLLYTICERQAADAGFRDLLTATKWPHATIGEQTQRAADGIARLVRRAKRAGALRKDFAAGDVRVLMMANGGIVRSSDDPAMWKRHIEYVIDGLRARS